MEPASVTMGMDAPCFSYINVWHFEARPAKLRFRTPTGRKIKRKRKQKNKRKRKREKETTNEEEKDED